MISVVMPAYNASRFIAEAIESILNQTYRDIELIVVDDGSTDNTVEIIKRYVDQDERVQLIQNNHGGANKARNTGIERAKYPWIGCMDADDVAHPERFEKQFQAAEKDPDVIIWGTYIYQINIEGKKLGTIENGPTSREAFNAIDRTKSPIQITQPTAIFKREVALKAGAYDERVKGGQEIELWDRMAQYGPAQVIPEYLLNYRLHDQSISSKRFFDQMIVYNYILERNKYRQRGETLDLEMYQKQFRAKPIWTRFFRYTLFRGQFQYRNAGVLLSEKKYPQAITSLLVASILAPCFTIKRILDRVQRHFK